ncbi:WD40 repeat domain-containing protein [Rubrivivax gelatinosus]|uniref:Uncharacterized protein n=1 Tax=Rubrivivax gelatinosus TaxID=28068 RepID=A0A4R2MJK6_RUBGE|nr:WD40 repeat domain-containing protein [Rubrivivax gelatinosus]MBK1688865.1 hypothetical protein [Rubrivivax gelatinosus]TCP03096.1 hypothetical protein EV684_105263 [Rubrivivax gelatinosus]
MFDARSFQQHADFQHDEQVAAMAWNAEGTRLASGSADGFVRVFEVLAQREEVRLPIGGYCGTLAWIPRTQRLLVGSTRGACGSRPWPLRTWCALPRRACHAA